MFKIGYWFFRATALICILFLLITCDKEISRSPVESEAPRGFIYINSNPAGFTIYQNDRNTGRLTPDSISFIEAGIYEITLKKKYFKDTTVTVNLGEDEKFNLYVDIASNLSMYGGLYLQSSPAGASVAINDSALNEATPLSLDDLLPGEYRIRFSKTNFRDSEIIAVVQSSKTSSYTEVLRDTSVWVDYQVFNSGIHSNSLSALNIDKNNVKWIGSLDKGLIRYDELNFTNYNISNSSIPSNIINCISIDNLNNVWVGTDKGIGVFNGSSWTIYDVNNSGLSSAYINVIKFDESGITWVGTSANIVKFDGFDWTLYNDPLGRDWIEDFIIEEQNKIWLGTKAAGIFILQDGSYNEFSRTQYSYPTYSISSMSTDNSGYLWFSFLPDTSGRGGISYWNGSSFTNLFPGTSGIRIDHLFIDESDNKWLSTSEGFVYLYGSITQFYTTSNSLISSNNTVASVKDKNGNIWITTRGGGLNKYKPPR